MLTHPRDIRTSRSRTCWLDRRIYFLIPGGHSESRGLCGTWLYVNFSDFCYSLLLYATLANSTYGPQGGSGLRKDDYESIGSSSFTQLAELRHRGAFSNVSQTFATCCLRCSQSNDPTISSLPQEWYQVGCFSGLTLVKTDV